MKFQDLIDSYKHHVDRENLEIGSLFYDGVEYLPYVLVKNVFHKKLQKHFFYFHHDIPDDGRTIDELLNFIDGDPSSSSNPAPIQTPKIKKKRRKNKSSASITRQTQREKSDSIFSHAKKQNIIAIKSYNPFLQKFWAETQTKLSQ